MAPGLHPPGNSMLHPPPHPQLHPSLHPQPPQLHPQVGQPFAAPKAVPRGNGQGKVLYRAECVLGKGSFGTVCKANVIGTNHAVAIKTVKPDSSGREVQALKRLRGEPNVAILLGTFEGVNADNEATVNLVLEYVADTLQRIIKHHRQTATFMDMHYVRIYTHQLFRGLGALNRHGVVHRDIKPANLLIDPATHNLKVCDFGTCKFTDQQETSLQCYVCSRYYRAPELILSQQYHNSAVDMWSAGCVLAEMILGMPLFAGKDGVDQLQQICEILGTPTPSELHGMNRLFDAAVHFGPPIEALSWDKVLGGRGNLEVQALLRDILQFDPNSRPAAMDSLAAQLFDELRQQAHMLDPRLFNFSNEELASCSPGLGARLLPWRQRPQ
eukprot:TRINITY_DN37532_c0_g1_i1.p1 TRINITY_DN37532_c0_g1~~TRINITY_DN37532_c0_g1_i1.p1  ORF type:complete len:441 (-),score=57.37 TRINITY_DN37532_c0_g1_i1:72-1223(-)